MPAPETNPHDRTLRYMMPDFTIALAIGLVIGFILGYGPRATPSTRKTTIIPLLSLVCRTARPAAAPHGPNDCGDLPPLAVLKQYADGVATIRDPPQPIAAQGRADPAYHPDCRSNVGDASSGRTAPPIFQSVSSDRDKHALCDFCNAAEFF